ncbi:hypothetical protein B296_00036139 [Ensete ventricosum]|uniref:Uncharacterized protein n=1 Tax=Ensete ventricosum TaxID=4639 RepID=A0A426ZM27_ENSVE|nr:hypothetical protein B296_00036139 [Ensete ventricosum]
MRQDSSYPTTFLPPCHTTHDTLCDVPLEWTSKVERFGEYEEYFLELSFPKKDHHVVNSFYIPHILKEVKLIRLWTASVASILIVPCLEPTTATSGPKCPSPTLPTWTPSPSTQPSVMTFAVISSTSSPCGRHCNFLEFDIFDLELTVVSSNSQLRSLLASTTPQISRSVIDGTHATTPQATTNLLYSSWAAFIGDLPSLVTLRSRYSSPTRSSYYDPALTLCLGSSLSCPLSTAYQTYVLLLPCYRYYSRLLPLLPSLAGATTFLHLRCLAIGAHLTGTERLLLLLLHVAIETEKEKSLPRHQEINSSTATTFSFC